jgi:hypothetical protein
MARFLFLRSVFTLRTATFIDKYILTYKHIGFIPSRLYFAETFQTDIFNYFSAN